MGSSPTWNAMVFGIATAALSLQAIFGVSGFVLPTIILFSSKPATRLYLDAQLKWLESLSIPDLIEDSDSEDPPPQMLPLGQTIRRLL